MVHVDHKKREAQKVSVSHAIEATLMQFVPMWMNDKLGKKNHMHNTLSQSDMCLAIIHYKEKGKD